MFWPLLILARAAALVAAPMQCEIVSEKVEEGRLLVGICGDSAVTLGSFSTYETMVNKETGGAIAVIERNGDKRLLLIRPGEGGGAVLEDLTGDVARKAGHVANASIKDLTIDISRFADAGIIAVTASRMPVKHFTGMTGELSVKKMIASEAKRQYAPKENLNVLDVLPDIKQVEAR